MLVTVFRKFPKTALWTPMGFCVALSALKLSMPDGAADPAFYAFLPMCFFGVGIVQLALWKRIETLEKAAGKPLQEDGSSDSQG